MVVVDVEVVEVADGGGEEDVDGCDRSWSEIWDVAELVVELE